MPIRHFRELIVWQRSIDLIAEVYRLTRQFPADERFGITSQLRSATVSVSSNIAEGSGRAATKDLLHFVSMSRGSIRESESLLLVSQRLDFLTPDAAAAAMGLTDEVSRMLASLRSSLQRR